MALVGKGGHIPHQLVHDLRELDGMGGRARATTSGAGALSVGNVALVVRRVEVLAVPAADILSG